jgi:hypothetical protein
MGSIDFRIFPKEVNIVPKAKHSGNKKGAAKPMLVEASAGNKQHKKKKSKGK